MDAIKINSNKRRITVTFDRNIFDDKEVNMFLNRLKVENLVREADFDSKILCLSQEINHSIWNEVKKEINFSETVK